MTQAALQAAGRPAARGGQETRGIAVAALSASAAALGAAFASEWWGGLVPCALCLLERWPYRVLIALNLLALLLRGRTRRAALALAALVALGGAGLGLVHVGVEQRWWPSPLPECAAPTLGGGTMAERLARMPAQPAKPCDDPTYLVPGVPVSMAAMNMLLSLALAAVLATSAGRRIPTLNEAA
jgi:disulfide bond formation protein DsbB